MKEKKRITFSVGEILGFSLALISIFVNIWQGIDYSARRKTAKIGFMELHKILRKISEANEAIYDLSDDKKITFYSSGSRYSSYAAKDICNDILKEIYKTETYDFNDIKKKINEIKQNDTQKKEDKLTE